jgi:hypothetical protein
VSIFNNNSTYPVIDLIRRELRKQGMSDDKISFDLDKSPNVSIYRNNPDDKYTVTDVVEDYGDFKVAYSIGRGYLNPVVDPTIPVGELDFMNKERVNSIGVSLIISDKTTKAYTIGLNYDGNGLITGTQVTQNEV